MATIVFASITIPITIATLTSLANIIKACIKLWVMCLELCLFKCRRKETRNIRNFERKCFALETLVTVLSITLQAAIFTWQEYLTDSRFTETLYSVFITASTIGFGDFSYNEEVLRKKHVLVKTVLAIVNLVLKYLNLAMVASVFTTLSEFKWRRWFVECCFFRKKSTMDD